MHCNLFNTHKQNQQSHKDYYNSFLTIYSYIQSLICLLFFITLLSCSQLSLENIKCKRVLVLSSWLCFQQQALKAYLFQALILIQNLNHVLHFLLILQHHLIVAVARDLQLKNVQRSHLRKITPYTPSIDASDFVKQLFLLCHMNNFGVTINYREIDAIF